MSRSSKHLIETTAVVFTSEMRSPRLETAYRETSFIAYTLQHTIRIRVGEKNPVLDSLLSESGIQRWAYITACNPGSVRLAASENFARQHELCREIQARGFTMFSGEGRSDFPEWPPEPSILVLGIDREQAIEIGRQYGQNAIVYGEQGSSVELVWIGPRGFEKD